MRTRANRTLLFLIGLVLLAVGVAVLVPGLDLPHRLGFTLPSWWPYRGPHSVLLSHHARTRYRGHSWWWPAVIAVLSVLVVVALWWLLAQARTRRPGRITLQEAPEGDVVLGGRALAEMLAADAEELSGVARARFTLTGRATAPAVRAALLVEPGAVPTDVVRDLDAVVLARARESAGLDALPAEVRLRAGGERGGRLA
ncbi:alkaline shock response membrane anchor protein AmaP [Streptomyces sp. PTM05]|uniref:Alkaline shock response membrane anchor protein AmaP n=1 Tax=Streptantibioticus parmotrematis TaxID=2873249 RepID=A0ABS7QWA7_9ACTN|nr:alkaline shock response membrane anchor protein AmaP [Streptantibioticus parmotrematis]MBY8887487.1 alkaline shock response membrane anchor protein AmaP [Streptantibioticus parmotrematis]